MHGDSKFLNRATNYESSSDSEQNVSSGPESVVPCDLATNPPSQRCDE